MPRVIARLASLVTAAVLSVVTSLAAAAPAGASATMTYPANGAAVTLDADANFSFAWTLPDGEVGPQVYVGDSPSYDPDTLAPFSGICGAPDTGQPAYSCRPGDPLAAGTHYAFIFTTNSDNTQHYYSPVTSFVVPLRLGWGCGPKLKGECGNNSAVQTDYVPHPPIGLPSSTLDVGGWLNAVDGTTVKFSFTLKHGRKVLARFHDAAQTHDFSVQSGFELTPSAVRFDHARHVRWHDPRGGTRLTATIVMSGGGLTLTRTATVRAPPAHG